MKVSAYEKIIDAQEPEDSESEPAKEKSNKKKTPCDIVSLFCFYEDEINYFYVCE